MGVSSSSILGRSRDARTATGRSLAISIAIILSIMGVVSAPEATAAPATSTVSGTSARFSAEWHTCFRVVTEGDCHVLAFNVSEFVGKRDGEKTSTFNLCLNIDHFHIAPEDFTFRGSESGCVDGPAGRLEVEPDLSTLRLPPTTIVVEGESCDEQGCVPSGPRSVSFSATFTGREDLAESHRKTKTRLADCVLERHSRGSSRTGVASATFDGIFFPEEASDDPGFTANASAGTTISAKMTCTNGEEAIEVPAGTASISAGVETCTPSGDDFLCEGHSVHVSELDEIVDGQVVTSRTVCAFHYVFIGVEGFYESGCADIEPGALQLAKDLSVGSLPPTEVTLDVLTCTGGSCEPDGTRKVVVDIQFTGTGAVLDGRSRLRLEQSGCVTLENSKGAVRRGEATFTLDGHTFHDEFHASAELGTGKMVVRC